MYVLLEFVYINNCQSSVHIHDFTCTCHIAAFFGYHSVILLLSFPTSAMLHRCTQAFLVHFFNLILKGNTIVVCFCSYHVLIISTISSYIFLISLEMSIWNFLVTSVKKLLQVIIMLYAVIYAINGCIFLGITYLDIVQYTLVL